ncbi:RING-H2 finger protein ATL52-like [Curcuma longa]|uniref:RING-H2 finger protein ATL52-like n=1 Tax=Curcuma longa TaxID=136217 RepID=UPI003D9F71D0
MVSLSNRILSPGCYDEDDCLIPAQPPPVPPSSSISLGTDSSLIPTLPIAAASLSVAAFVFIFVALYILHRRRGGRRTAAAPDADLELAFEDDDGEVDHHVWYIRTPGLDESTIGAIGTWTYKADEGVLGSSSCDCAVCLSEFQDGELLRLLPKCHHAFHIGCIDTWLRSHINCPLCRVPVVTLASATGGSVRGASTSSFSSVSSSLSSAADQAGSSSVPSGLMGLNQIDARTSETARYTLEVVPAAEGLELGAAPENRNMINQFPDSEIGMPGDVEGQEFQPIRRSFSMSSFPHAPALNRLELEGNTKEAGLRVELAAQTWRKQGNTSNGITSLQKEAGRFLSSTSERFFSSKHGRARSSVLPLR